MADKDSIPLADDELEPLSIEEATSMSGPSKIQAFGSAAAAAQKAQKTFKRSLNLTGAGATRVRMFNSKITLAAIDHMVEQINDWLDSNQIEVKHINTVVGTVEGKTAENNVIITVWY